MENNQSAARAAKRFLDDRIRTDWSYPQVPPPWEQSDEEVRSAVDFRERYYGESDSSDSDIEPNTGAGKDLEHDAYKFDSPDAIGDAVDLTREKRRKRRRMRLEEEMAENDGLRVWVERRDAWTGASSVRKYGPPSAFSKPDPPTTISQHDSGNGAEETMQLHVTSQPSNDATPDAFDLCPVAPRLLDDNLIRASITPKAYPDIYAKIVTSSRTPSVPINLSDMTKALVQGWKDTNEWPPKVGPIDPLAGKKRSIGGVLGGGREGLGRGEGGFIHRHPHLEKGVGSVKKILHLNGHHGSGEGAKEA
ncbi:hypothetical protein EKO04_003373 [Ascochyta lentis]|uniref:Gag1-like clamp domain-containing protein n=1 Tax=Ascochyta lentis TaxID=205686 RepID=A0A8H7J7Q0_9PLEO|nr:hypothetical protein EKO04_003373 [Ascochyta lentis]